MGDLDALIAKERWGEWRWYNKYHLLGRPNPGTPGVFRSRCKLRQLIHEDVGATPRSHAICAHCLRLLRVALAEWGAL